MGYGKLIEAIAILPQLTLSWLVWNNRKYYFLEIAWLFWYIHFGKSTEEIFEKN